MSRKRPVSKEFMFSSIMEPFTTTQRLLYVYCIIDADDDGIVGNIDVIRHQINTCVLLKNGLWYLWSRVWTS